MAKKSSIEKNEHRRTLVKQYAARRAKLKSIADAIFGLHLLPDRLKVQAAVPGCRRTGRHHDTVYRPSAERLSFWGSTRQDSFTS